MADDRLVIGVKLEGDATGAKRAFDQVEAAARRAETQSERTRASLDRVTTAARRVFSTQGMTGLVGGRVRSGLGALGGSLSGGAGLGPALLAGVGALVPELGIALGIYSGGSNVFANLSGEQGRLNKAIEELGIGAASPAAEVANILAVAKERGSQQELWKSPSNLLRLGGETAREAGHTLRKEAVKKMLANYTAAELAVMAPSFPPMYDDVVHQAIIDAQRREKMGAAAQQWRGQINQTNTNVYASIVASGGRGSTGRQISAATTIRDRNNGRSTTTLSRRG